MKTGNRAMGVNWTLLTGALLMASGLSLVGCDEAEEEPAKPASEEKKVVPPPAAPAPAPEPEPEPKTATKKLEDCEKGSKVVFDNEAVEAHIRMKSQKPEGDITTADLRRLKSVNFSRVQLDTLDTCLFTHMKSLKEVFLGPGKVWDLSPLAGLKNLETVRIAGNPVEDLSPLAEMTKMDRIDISDTKIKDISAMEKMTKLTEVTLDGAPVEDISALAAAPDLEMLSIKRTQIKSLAPLKDSKKLEQLFVAESAIADDISATGVVHKNGTKVMTD
jgi:internalin A